HARTENSLWGPGAIRVVFPRRRRGRSGREFDRLGDACVLLGALPLDLADHPRNVRLVQKTAWRLGVRILLESRPFHLPQRGDFGFLPTLLVDPASLSGHPRAHAATVDLDTGDVDGRLRRPLQLAALVRRGVTLALFQQLAADLL